MIRRAGSSSPLSTLSARGCRSEGVRCGWQSCGRSAALDRVTMGCRTGRMVVIIVVAGLLSLALVGTPSAAKLTPAVRARIIAAAVELAVIADVAAPNHDSAVYLPVGSGTIISP